MDIQTDESEDNDNEEESIEFDLDRATAELIDSKLTSLHQWEAANANTNANDNDNAIVDAPTIANNNTVTNKTNITATKVASDLNIHSIHNDNDDNNDDVDDAIATNEHPTHAFVAAHSLSKKRRQRAAMVAKKDEDDAGAQLDELAQQLLTNANYNTSLGNEIPVPLLEFDDLLSILKSDSLANYFCQCRNLEASNDPLTNALSITTNTVSEPSSSSPNSSSGASLATLHPALQSLLVRLPTCPNCSKSILSTSMIDSLERFPSSSSPTFDNTSLYPSSIDLASKVTELERKLGKVQDLWKQEIELSAQRLEMIRLLQSRIKTCEDTTSLLSKQFLSLLSLIRSNTDLQNTLKVHDERFQSIEKQQQTLTSNLSENSNLTEMKKLLHNEIELVRKKDADWKKSMEQKLTNLEVDHFYPSRSKILELLSSDENPNSNDTSSIPEPSSFPRRNPNPHTLPQNPSHHTPLTSRRFARKSKR